MDIVMIAMMRTVLVIRITTMIGIMTVLSVQHIYKPYLQYARAFFAPHVQPFHDGASPESTLSVQGHILCPNSRASLQGDAVAVGEQPCSQRQEWILG